MPTYEELARERIRIFNTCWFYIGDESELAQPGDFRRRRVGDKQVLIVRGQDGEIRVFLNRCPHQGALVCRQDEGNAALFQCFYHDWVFNDRGELVELPDNGLYDEGYDMSLYKMQPPPRVAKSGSRYFVSFNPDIEDLESYLAGLVSDSMPVENSG
jgi:phenylpropionate dioxygenase-like ring-hydroxylating dioxygenase large terminal subunit